MKRQLKPVPARAFDGEVEVYRNLHLSSEGDPVYSVRDARTRRVLGHTRAAELHDVRFVVSEAGRQRVLRERRRNVHAVVRGWLRSVNHGDAADVALRAPRTAAAVTYNPYRAGAFTRRDDGAEVHAADVAFVGPAGVCVV